MWIRKGLRYVFMDQATDGAGGSSAGTSGSGSDSGSGSSGGGSDGTGGSSGQSADGANSGTKTTGGSGTGSGNDTAGSSNSGQNGSALQASGAAQPAQIPEKYQVKKEDGSIDIEASSQKLAEAYSHLEKRIGTGDLPPKSAEEYKFEVPEEFKPHWQPDSDKMVEGFKSRAFKEGLTQSQFDFVMGEYFEIAPALVGASTQLDSESCVAELQKEWKTKEKYDAETGKAYKATVGFFGKDAEYIMEKYGNNPVLIRGLAKIGAEMGEDRSTNNGGQGNSAESVQSLIASEAYTNPKHPDHARVSKQVSDYYAAQEAHDKKSGNARIF